MSVVDEPRMASASVDSPMYPCCRVDRKLTGDDRRAVAVPILDDLDEIASVDVGEWREAPSRRFVSSSTELDEAGYRSYDNRYADLLFEVATRRYE